MNKPIRVLNVVNTMNIGGYESFIMNVYRNIDRSRVQFDFLTHGGLKNAFDEEILRLGGRIYPMPAIKTNTRTNYWRFFSYRKALKEFFSTHHEYTIMHGHMTNTASIYAPIAKQYGAVTCFIAHSHQSTATPGLSGVASRLLQRNLPRLATECFSCSEQAAHWLFPQEYIDAGKVSIVKNGVDPKRFHYDERKREAMRRKLELGERLVIGNVARFKTEKNHSFQLDIFKELLERSPDAILLLVGDGELRAQTEQKAARLGIADSIRFMGVRSDISDLMQAMDCFILPSFHEGLPVVGVEAQATGLPVIMSTGVSREADITGNATFLELELGAREWADRILDVCSSFERRDMTEYIRANGYDITQTAEWLTNFYIEHAGKARR